jgi:lysophospholipase L1-like esterase
LNMLSRRRIIAALTVIVAAGTTTAIGVGVSHAEDIGQAGDGAKKSTWVGTWAASETEASHGNTSGSLTGFTDQSVREIVHTSVGGNALRIRLTNEYGTTPLAIGHVTVGLPTAPASADLVPDSIHTLTFAGSQSATVNVGADLISDPVQFDVPALHELAVTIYLPTATGPTSWHWQARETTYVYSGDQAANPSGAGPTATPTSFFFLAGIDVRTRDADESVVVMGDSISDGYGSPVNANTRWPDFLAARMQQQHPAKHVFGVLNESLSGNAVNHDGSESGFPAVGHNGLARLGHDAYANTAADAIIIELGVNDIQSNGDPADKIIAGLRQIGQQLRERGVRALVCTLGPFEGYSSWTADKETTRLAVNAYIRGNHDFDAVVDMDAALRDPAAPSHLRADLDSGDHIHPNEAGAQAFAAAVPLGEL